MPLFPYRCSDCGGLFEVLHASDGLAPKRCGHRCVADREHPARGMGELTRQVTAPNVVRAEVANDNPSMEDLQKKGFTAYRNQGDGTLKKVGKGGGPEVIAAGPSKP